MNTGDVVLYTVQDKSYKALVLLAHSNEVSYLGENGEPLLHLAFLAPDRESNISKSKIGWLPSVYQVHDIPHVSSKVQTVNGKWDVLPETKSLAQASEAIDSLEKDRQQLTMDALNAKLELAHVMSMMPQPSAEDLDAVAAEQQAAEATQGDTNV